MKRVNYIKCRSFVHQDAIKKEEREAPQGGKEGFLQSFWLTKYENLKYIKNSWGVNQGKLHLRPTLIIQDNLSSRTLIISAKPLPNKLTDSRDQDLLSWMGNIIDWIKYWQLPVLIFLVVLQ